MGTHAKLFKSAENLNLHGKLKYRLAIFLRHASIVYESISRETELIGRKEKVNGGKFSHCHIVYLVSLVSI